MCITIGDSDVDSNCDSNCNRNTHSNSGMHTQLFDEHDYGELDHSGYDRLR
jgi:hypothetical protein